MRSELAFDVEILSIEAVPLVGYAVVKAVSTGPYENTIEFLVSRERLRALGTVGSKYRVTLEAIEHPSEG